MKLLIVVEGFTTTQTLIEQALKKLKHIKYSIVLIDDLSLNDFSDSVVFFSRVSNPRYMWLPEFLHNRNVPFIYFTDDNFWEFCDGSVLANYYQNDSVLSTLDNFIKYANLILVGTENLEIYLRQKERLGCIDVIPFFVDFSIIDEIFTSKQIFNTNSVKSSLRIGYSGSLKEEAFAPVRIALNQLKTEYGENLQIEFIGSRPSGFETNSTYFPPLKSYRSYLSFKMSRQWDVALAPLTIDTFSACKTDNKYREYSACNIAGVYTSTPPYSNSVVNNQTGILVDHTAKGWYLGIKLLLTNEKLREKIRNNSRLDVQNLYSLSKIVNKWDLILSGFNEKVLLKSKREISKLDETKYLIAKNGMNYYYLIRLFFLNTKKHGFVDSLVRIRKIVFFKCFGYKRGG